MFLPANSTFTRRLTREVTHSVYSKSLISDFSSESPGRYCTAAVRGIFHVSSAKHKLTSVQARPELEQEQLP